MENFYDFYHDIIRKTPRGFEFHCEAMGNRDVYEIDAEGEIATSCQ